MNDQTDSQLLRAYAEQRSEAAFSELVHRQVDFVYSAALRMVCDSHLAQDVTQSVFIALAKNAIQLTDRPVLSGWLHRTAQNIAAQSVRTDVRRRVREQEAAAMNELLSAEPDANWEHIAPHLDAALGALSEPDRDALLLRYFERKSAREMAQTLGTSEEAAQKRVSRAVERLREYFAKRGVTAGASGLVVVISANAVQAAPVGLAITISSAATALAGTAIAATATATKAIAMTTLQKTLVTTTVAVLAGAGIYEARQASQLREQIRTIHEQQAPLTEQIQQLTRERDEATHKLAALRAENERLGSNTSELLRLRGEVGRLREQAEKENPLKGDNMSALTSIQVPTNQTEFEEVKKQMSTALHRIGFALRQYMTNNPFGVIVEDSGQLNQTIFATMPALPLDAFQIIVRDVQHLANAMERYPKLIIAKSTAPISFDGHFTHHYLLADGSVTATTLGLADEPIKDGFLLSDGELRTLAQTQDPVRRTLLPALEAFASANNGRRPTDPTQLQPYITTPEQQAMLQQEIEKLNLRNAVGISRTNYQFSRPYHDTSPTQESVQQHSIEKP